MSWLPPATHHHRVQLRKLGSYHVLVHRDAHLDGRLPRQRPAAASGQNGDDIAQLGANVRYPSRELIPRSRRRPTSSRSRSARTTHARRRWRRDANGGLPPACPGAARAVPERSKATTTRIAGGQHPDLYRIVVTLQEQVGARLIWASAEICQSMLANPTSTTMTNETAPAGRSGTRQRVQRGAAAGVHGTAR